MSTEVKLWGISERKRARAMRDEKIIDQDVVHCADKTLLQALHTHSSQWSSTIHFATNRKDNKEPC